MVADLAGRTAEADRFYAAAQGGGAALSLREAQILASWQARSGRKGVATATIQAIGNAGAELALAVPGLERGIAIRPVERPTDGIAEAYLALAGALHQQQAADYALLLLHLALGLRPDFTPARLLMADTQAELGDNARALATLDGVPANDALAPVVAFRRAIITGAMGQTDDAARMLETLARTYPQRPEALQALGDILRQKHRYADAVSAYTRALARMPHAGAQAWAIYFNRGSAYDRAHDWPKAQADLERALELAPNQPVVLNYLGYAWTEQGRNLERARQMLEKAVSLRPNDGNIVDSLGWVLLRQGDTAGAVRELERAVEMEPEDATINGHLGDAYWAAGRRLEAQYQWRRALDLEPEPEDVPKLQAKLRDASSAALARQNEVTATPGAPHRVQ
jgi:Flp pilus assembly protein TadD